MNTISVLVLLTLVTGLKGSHVGIVQPSVGGVVPLPTKITYTGSSVGIPHDFHFTPTYTTKCDMLAGAFERIRAQIFAGSQCDRDCQNKASETASQFSALKVSVKNLKCDDLPSETMDESYQLVADSATTAVLSANEVWGVLRGLETFSQLTFTSDLGQTFGIKLANVTDKPRFKHRGILLDTSRHFLPVKYILLNLDLMAQSKMNVFHWHIVDDPSFPFVSEVFPQLSAKGAYSPHHIYSPADVKRIVEYARVRGIRVVPEFDTPGHVESWGHGLPDLLTKCYDTKTGKPTGYLGPIDPSRYQSYDTVLSLLTEVLKVFPDRYVHLGGDEVAYGYDCWGSNPGIQAFMNQMGYGSDFSKLQSYYTQRLLGLVDRARSNAGYIVWEEVFTHKNKVKNDTVIHVWTGETKWADTMADVTKAGLQGILSSCWYLNYVHYGIDWGPHYDCDPQNFQGTEEQKGLVIGGEACMWGEYVDATNVIPRLWPRASVVAERLWSSEAVKDHSKFAPRLEEHRCRLMRRGYQVEPMNGPGFCPVEWE